MFKHYFIKLLILFLLLSQFVTLAHAKETTSLDEMTVTARPIGLQSIEHIAQPINIISKDELANRQSSSIGETLSNVPGVTTNRFSPLASRPIICGLGGSRVLVLENGVNSMDVSTISVDHAVTIDPVQTEQIEIFRGHQPYSMAAKLLAGWSILLAIVFLMLFQTLIQTFIPVITAIHLRNYFSSKAKGVMKRSLFILMELNVMQKITAQKKDK